jgi:hypothetical protein
MSDDKIIMSSANLKSGKITWEDVCQDFADRNWDNGGISETENREFYNWMLTKESLGLLFDHYAYFRAFQIQKSLRADNDHFIVILGPPGKGKSTFTSQLMACISPDFKLENICYNIGQYALALQNRKKYNAIQLDEGALILNAMDNSKTSVLVDKVSAIMRQYNLCISICMVDIKQLRRHFRETRINSLFIINKRGRYDFIYGDGINTFREKIHSAKKFDPINDAGATFIHGSFTKNIPKINDVTEDSYRQHKKENSDDFIDEFVKLTQTENKNSNLILLSKINDLLKVPFKPSGMNYHILRGNLKVTKVGKRKYVTPEDAKEFANKVNNGYLSFNAKNTKDTPRGEVK